jgi:anaerobic dimethyl sulfoxide reductase subunit C (anchor subunit)
MAGEWSLVAFTVLGQLAVGIYFFIGGPLYFGEGLSGAAAAGARPASVLAVLGSLAVATVLSLFHLHHPIRAHKIFSNLGTSWLSREILTELLFMGIIGVLGFCDWRRIGGEGTLKVLFVFGGLAGGVFILTMSRLYMLPSVQSWNRVYTPLSFCLTALVLGSLASVVFFGLSAAMPPFIGLLPVVSLVSVVACLASASLLAPGYGVFGAKPEPSLRQPGGTASWLHAARISGLLSAAVLLGAAVAAKDGPILGIAPRSAVFFAVFFLAAAGEVSGRFLFYSLSGRRS